MQIIIIGSGKVGTALATQLIKLEHDVVVVEEDSQLIRNVSHLDCIKIAGVPIDLDILKQAGIETADSLCAVTQTDNINIMVAQIASTIFKVPQIVARIFNPAKRSVFEAFNINTVSQTEMIVEAFLRKISSETGEINHKVCNADILYTSVPIEDDLVGEDILDLSTDSGKLIFGVLRNGKLTLAAPGLKVQAGDELVLAGIQK